MLVLAAAISVFAQTEGAYEAGGPRSSSGIGAGGDGTPYLGLLDPARFSVSHSMSFMAGGAKVSDLKSQSLYSTLMQYKFSAPLVLSLNFDMPIHSTFNPHSNLTNDNLASMDYFRNIPIDASLTWMPSDRFLMRVSVYKPPESGYSPYYGFHRSDRFFRGW